MIGGRDAVVTGVAPQGFRGLRGGEMNEASGFAVYVPLAHVRDWPGARRPEQRWLNVYGRLTVPLDRERLAAELLPLAGRIEATDPVTRRHARIAVTESWLTPDATMTMLLFLYVLMLSAPLTVLAIGCANVANLQLVRASLRTRELAVRASLGASRGQIIRLLTFEAVLLVFAAFATGAIGIWILLRVAALVVPMPVHLDTRVMLFTAALAAAGDRGNGPAAWAHLDPFGRLCASAQRRALDGVGQLARAPGPRRRTGHALLSAASGRGCLYTRHRHRHRRGAATRPAHAHHRAALRRAAQVRAGRAPRFVDAFDARMRADSRVRGIAYTTSGPFSSGSVRVWRSGDPPDAGQFTDAVSVAGDFFDISGVRVLRGRALTRADAAATTAVVVQRGLHHEIPAHGARGGPAAAPLALARGRSGASPRHDCRCRVTACVGRDGRPNRRGPDGVSAASARRPTSSRRGSARTTRRRCWMPSAASSRISIRSCPRLPCARSRTTTSKTTRRCAMIAQTAGGLGIVALLLAVSGLYSVIAFFVALRTSEFGIRVALGARSADIVRMVLGQALRLAGIGLAVGAVLGTPLLIALHANFPFTERFDPAGHSADRPRARPDRSFRGLGAGSQSVLDPGVGGPQGRLGRHWDIAAQTALASTRSRQPNLPPAPHVKEPMRPISCGISILAALAMFVVGAEQPSLGSGRVLPAGLCCRRRRRRRPVRHPSVRVHGQHAWLEEAARLPAVPSVPSGVPASRHRRHGRVGQSRLPEPGGPVPPQAGADLGRLARTRFGSTRTHRISGAG